jgi:hypothetical protein
MGARRISSDNAAEEYERRTGRVAWADYAWPRAMAAMVFVGRNVGTRLRRVASGVQRSKIAVAPAPLWVEQGLLVAEGIRRLVELAGLPPVPALDLAVAGYDEHAWMRDGSDAVELRAVRKLVGQEAAVRGATALAGPSAGKDELQAFHRAARMWLEHWKQPYVPATFALLAGAAGMERFERLTAQTIVWRDRIESWEPR